MLFTWSKDKHLQRVHIKTDVGTECKMENELIHKAIEDLDMVSDELPKFRRMCKPCLAKLRKATGIQLPVRTGPNPPKVNA